MQDCTSTCSGRETVPSMDEQAHLNKYKIQTDGLKVLLYQSLFMVERPGLWNKLSGKASVFWNQMSKEDSWYDMAWAHYEQSDFVTII